MSPSFKHVGDTSQRPPTRLSRVAMRALYGWLRPYRWAILLNTGLTLILAAVELTVPKLLKWTIDGLIAAESRIRAAAAAQQAALLSEAWQRTLVLIGGFVGLFTVASLLRRIELRRITSLGQRCMCEMRKRYFDHLHKLSLRYYSRMKAGQIISRGTSDMDALEHVVSWAPSQLASAVFLLVGVVVLMVQEDPILFLAVLPCLAVQVLWTQRFRVRASETWRRVRRQSGRLTANLAESIAGARVIQAFAREQRSMGAFGALADGLYTTRLESVRILGRYMIGTRSLATLATVTVLGLGGWRVAAGHVSAGSLAALLGYLVIFFRPIETVSELYNMLLHALAGAERILEVLDTEPEIVDSVDAVTPATLAGAVEFDHVTFEYEPGAVVLRDLSLRVRPGETVALVGPTGVGKTTICRLIARFYEAQQGVVRIDGWDVRALTQQGLHDHMGIVLQENFLFNGTVMDNIRYGRMEATDDEVVACARSVGSYAVIASLPQSFAAAVGERGESLSAGQRQLVCYTRAMLANPRILILDEATSSVDTLTELMVQEALQRLTERRTCFIVAHRLSTVRRADRVLVISDGGISEQGTHAELMAAGGRYARMYAEFISSE